MNPEQIKSGVRWLVAFAGGFIVARGWIKADQLTALLGNEAIMGALGGCAVLIWGLITHTEKNAVAVVAMIAADPASPVKGVVTTDTQEGRALARAIPESTIVSAGTPAAAQIARTGATS